MPGRTNKKMSPSLSIMPCVENTTQNRTNNMWANMFGNDIFKSK